MARKLQNSRINPDKGTAPDSADRAARRAHVIAEASEGAANGRTQAEREAAKQALQSGNGTK